MAWHQITFTLSADDAEAFGDLLVTELDSVSVTFADTADNPIYEPELNKTELWQSTNVIALWEEDVDPQEVILKLVAISDKYQDIAYKIEFIPDQDWTRVWMDQYEPMCFGEKLWICPTDKQVSVADAVVVTLDPGLAFGTGTHPTTRMCLQWLDKLAANNQLQGKTIIDYGCGSGILGIAALLLGAKEVYAVDIDPQAIEATIANAEKNHVSEKIHTFLVEEFAHQEVKSQILVANILAGPLVELAPTLGALQSQDGLLALSGILAEKEPYILEAYSKDYHIQVAKQDEDWLLFTGVHK